MIARRAADADIRPTKKRCTQALQRCADPGQPQERVGVGYPGPALGQHAHGTSIADGIPGLATSSQPPYLPGSAYPFRPAEPVCFDANPHRTGTREESWAPNTYRVVAEQLPALNVDATIGPGHTLWGLSPPSPVDQITAGSSTNHWSPSIPTVPPPHGNQESYDRLQANASYLLNSAPAPPHFPATKLHPYGRLHRDTDNGHGSLTADGQGSHDQLQISPVCLPTPPPFPGTDLSPYAGLHLERDNGCFSLAADGQGYGHGTSHNQSSYRSPLGELAPLGNIVTPEFDSFGGYFPPAAAVDGHYVPANPQRLETTVQGAATLRDSGIGFVGTEGPTVKQPHDGGWIEKVHSAHTECDDRKSISIEVQLESPYANGGNGSAKLGYAADGESSRDRKRRARFAERLRRETSKTRSMGACLRCHNQRVRVSAIA